MTDDSMARSKGMPVSGTGIGGTAKEGSVGQAWRGFLRGTADVQDPAGGHMDTQVKAPGAGGTAGPGEGGLAVLARTLMRACLRARPRPPPSPRLTLGSSQMLRAWPFTYHLCLVLPSRLRPHRAPFLFPPPCLVPAAGFLSSGAPSGAGTPSWPGRGPRSGPDTPPGPSLISSKASRALLTPLPLSGLLPRASS